MKAEAAPTLDAVLQKQGFASRREARKKIRAGAVRMNGEKVENPDLALPPELFRKPLLLEVDGLELPFRERLHLLFHKPRETECSHSPSQYRGIYSFFPEPFLRRGLSAAGRLDADTSGLLLLSDEGAFLHAVTSPRRGISKTYRARTRHDLDEAQMAVLKGGVLLHGESAPTVPLAAERKGDRLLELRIGEGKYHQVKRMVAAMGNRCEELERVAIGGLSLPPDLGPGEWRFLQGDDFEALGLPVPAGPVP